MKAKYILIVVFFTGKMAYAQINAITNTGREVLLYENGTWKYIDESEQESTAILINEQKFEKDKSNSFLIKSTKLNIGLWINPKKWTFKTGKDTEAAEFQFQLKGEDLYAMLIAEKMEIPLESFKQVVIQNAREAAPDVELIHEEYRIVNGITVLMLQLGGSLSGISFIYKGYYFSNSNGSIQLVTYTAKNLSEQYQKDIEEFINGLVEL